MGEHLARRADLLVATTERHRGLLGGAISRYTPVYPTMADALAAARRPPARRRAGLDLPASTVSSRVARAWGCTPQLNGGKVVWAALRCDETH